ncbi:hypothetical protein [Caulobacter segnis]|uniref:Uncharacterized protein n=1 Tax=Caulobacter segnis TaxID=88688 RepID=A0A2W5X6J4_9CAUL|nr:hypothetical protein [Caulobacter segnis]PZR36494.1 MAG: hypothetical protein DI526_03395 [Caulobacter segnis]
MQWLSTRALAIIAVAVWVLLFVVLHFQKLERERPMREAAAAQAEAIERAETILKARLKDPFSAQFSDVRVLGNGAQERVCGRVNAKNSFGAYGGPERFLVMSGSAYLGDQKPGKAIWSRPEHPCDVF